MTPLRFLPGWRGPGHAAQPAGSDDSDVAGGVDLPTYPERRVVGDVPEERPLRLGAPLDPDGWWALSDRSLL